MTFHCPAWRSFISRIGGTPRDAQCEKDARHIGAHEASWAGRVWLWEDDGDLRVYVDHDALVQYSYRCVKCKRKKAQEFKHGDEPKLFRAYCGTCHRTTCFLREREQGVFT